MEVFFIALAGNLENCLLDTKPHNYEFNLKINYDDFRLSVVKRKSVLEDNKKEVNDYKERGDLPNKEVGKEKNTSDFWNVQEEEMNCFEDVLRQDLQNRNSEIILGIHRITYFYSDNLVAMPDYLYDTPVPSFPLLIGIDVEKMLMIH